MQNVLWGVFKRRKRKKSFVVIGGHGRIFIISNVTIATLRMFPDHVAKGHLECCRPLSQFMLLGFIVFNIHL
jgi:hypothetical protein